jgi:methylated-DNA-protein-cysteine methyltransferase-like protein
MKKSADSSRRFREESDADSTAVEQVFALARSIPCGKVLSYGALGAQCTPPISGYVCGRIMNCVADDVPWWRVVAKDGRLPVSKRSPLLALEQRQTLESEGVEFDNEGRVKIEEFAAT